MPKAEAAVKVTWVPAHTGFCEGEMERVSGCQAFTVMITGFDNAGEPVIQLSEEVSVQVMVSPSAGMYS